MPKRYFSGKCSICHKDKPRVHRSFKTKKLVCRGCISLTNYYKRKKADSNFLNQRRLARKSVICAICEQPKPPVKRLGLGKKLCLTCYHRVCLQGKCLICGMTRPIKVRISEKEVICVNCYKSKRYPAWLAQQQSSPNP